MRRGFTSFRSRLIVPALVVGAGTFFLSCSMTHEVLRTEKTVTEPAVISGPVEWSESIDINEIPSDEIFEDNGIGEFEIETAPGAISDAKVKFRYHMTYEPKKKVSMSIDSASVETKKETTTVTVTEKTVVEKKIYKTLLLICIGIVLALAAILALRRFL